MAKSTIDNALKRAINQCQNIDLEEEGGVILHHPDKAYMFVKIRNANTGKPLARGLWTADRAEFGKKVIPTFKDGWTVHASFHTHPQFSVNPSMIDMTELFMGFPINYIYGNKTKQLARYTWVEKGVSVRQEMVS